MKIYLSSDLHIEFAGYLNKLPEADIGVLAGDICVASSLIKNGSKHPKNVANLFKRMQDKYEHVIQIMGNHEHYGGEWNDTKSIIEEFLHKQGIDRTQWHFMEKQYVDLQGFRFIGATLWTDFNNDSPMSKSTAMFGLNDYRIITKNGHPLQPNDTLFDHLDAREAIEEHISKTDLPVIVVTHHAPSRRSLHPRWKNEHDMNGAYSSNLEDVMTKQVKLWMHGHTHDSFDYTVDSTRVVCNPRGYQGWEPNTGFKPQLVLEV